VSVTAAARPDAAASGSAAFGADSQPATMATLAAMAAAGPRTDRKMLAQNVLWGMIGEPYDASRLKDSTPS
jgi:hypothetical protein